MKQENKHIYISYQEHSTGGEICAGQEGNSFPDHEDEIIDFKLV